MCSFILNFFTQSYHAACEKERNKLQPIKKAMTHIPQALHYRVKDPPTLISTYKGVFKTQDRNKYKYPTMKPL